MKRLSLLTLILLLAACGEEASVSTSTSSPPNATTVETAPADSLVETAEEMSDDENENTPTEQPHDTEPTTEDETYSDEALDLFIGASTAIDTLASWSSYHSVKMSEHIVHTNPANSYQYKETLSYVKQPHASHLIYESENPVYMEIYANTLDGMYANDDAVHPNWTYTMDRDTIQMWQEEPLPDTMALLQAIVEQHTKFTVLNASTQTVEYFVQTPSTAIDTLLFGGDSEFHMLQDVMLTIAYTGTTVEQYTVVGNYVTQEEDEGQFVVNEVFHKVNELQSVRVPDDVKEQAMLDEEVIDWHE